MAIKIAIGLGNSGSEYDRTRHNVGRMALMSIAECAARASGKGVSFVRNKYCSAWLAKTEILQKPIVLAYSDGYMNNSGVALASILKHLKLDISEVLVVYDDIGLEVGRMKLSKGGSAGGHNGVDDIMQRCGNDFVRLRIGIGAKADKRMNLADHVLGKISDQDLATMSKLDVYDCVCLLVSKGLAAAQNAVNRTEGKSDCGNGCKCGSSEVGTDSAEKAQKRSSESPIDSQPKSRETDSQIDKVVSENPVKDALESLARKFGFRK